MRHYVKQPDGAMYSADAGGIIFDPQQQRYFSCSRKAWFPTDSFADEGAAPANGVFEDIGKAILTIGTGGLAAPLLYSGGGASSPPAPQSGITIDGVPVGQTAATTTAPGVPAAAAVTPSPLPTAAGSPWFLDSVRNLYASAFDGGIWYDPTTGKYFSGRLQVWLDGNPATGAGFPAPAMAANGTSIPLPPTWNPEQPGDAEHYEQMARSLESQASSPAGDANRVLADYLRLPVSERIRFFLMFNQSEEAFDLDDTRKINRATRGDGVDVFSRTQFERRLRQTYGGKPPANGEWYNDLLGGVHLVGSGILGAFGLSGVSETLESVEGDALPRWARKKKASDSSMKGNPKATPDKPRRDVGPVDDRDDFSGMETLAADGTSAPRRSPSGGRILGRPRR